MRMKLQKAVHFKRIWGINKGWYLQSSKGLCTFRNACNQKFIKGKTILEIHVKNLLTFSQDKAFQHDPLSN